jgi:hypothetical protein
MNSDPIVTIKKLQPDQRSGLKKMFFDRKPASIEYAHMCVCTNCFGRLKQQGWEWMDYNVDD